MAIEVQCGRCGAKLAVPETSVGKSGKCPACGGTMVVSQPSTDPQQAFDPYHKWLGIAPAEQPPSHYRLLGIGPFESDPEVISNAADQRMAHVRGYQGGEHLELATKLLNEISAARVCLLNAAQKAEYDRQASQVQPELPQSITPERVQQERHKAASLASRATAPKPGDPNAAAPLAGLLKEDLTAGSPIEDPLGGNVEVAGKLKGTKKPKRSAKSPKKRGSTPLELNGRMMIAVGVVAALLFVIFCLLEHARTGTVLTLFGVGIVLMGLLRRSEEIELLIAQIAGCALVGLSVLLMVGNVARTWYYMEVLFPANGRFTVFVIDALIGLSLAIGVISTVFYLSSRFGFFRIWSWCYVGGLGVFPAIAVLVGSLPEGRSLPGYSFIAPPALETARRPPVRRASVPGHRPSVHTRQAQVPPRVRVRPRVTVKPPEPPPSRQWNVAPDGATPSEVTLGGRPFALNCLLNELERVAFSPADAGRAVALCARANVKSGSAGSGKPSCWLDYYDLRAGRHLGTITMPGKCRLADVSPDGTRALVVVKGHAEVWALDEGKFSLDWQFGSPRAVKDGDARFVDDDHVATLDDDQGQVTVWTLPDRNQVFSTDNVTCMLPSPGGKHLVVFDRSVKHFAGRVIDAASGKELGQLANPSRDGFAPASCRFRRDGRQLAALGSGALAVWDVQTGEVAAEDTSVSSAASLEFLPGGLIRVGGYLFDATRKSMVWRYDLPGGRRGWEKIDGSPDGRVWLAAAGSMRGRAYLGSIELPDADVAPLLVSLPARPGSAVGNSQISAKMLFGGYLPAELTKPPDITGRPGVTVPSGATDQQLHCGYLRQTYLDLISGDGNAVIERLRWYPALKRPAIGLRWGAGVYWAGQVSTPTVATAEDLGKITGPIGPGVLVALGTRMDDGRFGDWPKQGDPRLRRVTILGTGTRAELLQAAAERKLDLLASFELSTKAIGLTGRTETSLRVRLVDVTSKQPLWMSRSVTSSQLLAARRAGTDEVGKFVTEATEAIDAEFCLKSMPVLKPEHAKRRVATLLEELPQGEAALPALAELRYYQAKQLLSAVEVEEAYDYVLGVGKGRTLADENPSQRRIVLEAWLRDG